VTPVVVTQSAKAHSRTLRRAAGVAPWPGGTTTHRQIRPDDPAGLVIDTARRSVTVTGESSERALACVRA